MKKLWNIRPATPELASSLAKEFSVSLPIAQLLAHRGITESKAVSAFLSPRLQALADPFLLPDMDKAVDRLLAAIRAKEKIIVFGDYDVDGMTSIALILEILGRLGGVCGFFLPSRFADGYGLKKESVDRCIQDGARLIVSVDCGTNSTEEILYAKSKGVEFIVLDHHEHTGAAFEAVAVVNPKRKDSRYKEELASAGISFKLAHALIKRCRENSQKEGGEAIPWQAVELKDLLDFAAVGTVADMVPLVGENRILVRAGIERLGRSIHPGLRILRDLASSGGVLTATDIAFRIAPRLNANGRLSDAQDSLALLRTFSETEAMALAQKLQQENQRRQAIEKQTTEEAIALVRSRREFQNDKILVLYQPQWHIGVVGIVAAKIVKEFGKPAVVIGLEAGVGKGSARSVEGFNIAEALAAAKADLVACGGHAQAAGLTIEPVRVEAFRKGINDYARKAMIGVEGVKALLLDLDLPKEQLDGQLIEQLDALEPFGMGNPRPVFATHRIGVAGKPFIVGKNHLKFQTKIKDTMFDVMGFRMGLQEGADVPASITGRKLDIAYHPCVNVFNGQRRFQLNLEDFRISE